MTTLTSPPALLFLCLLLIPFSGLAQSKQEIPPAHFQGGWNVERHFFRTLREGVSDFDKLGEESAKGRYAPSVEIRFRLHDSGAIQRIWTDRSGKVIESKGVTIIKATKNEVTFRPWSDHPTWNTILILKEDDTAVLQVRSLKHQETFLLRKNKKQ